MWWFQASDELDALLKDRFESLLEPARLGELDHWKATPRGALALIILMDQFPRNIYRGSSKAFCYDPASLEITKEGLDNGWWDRLTKSEKMFALLPLEHSENLADQERCVEELRKDGDMQLALDFAIAHRDTIKRFGRFPHRNQVLGRKSTPEEEAYLRSGAERYGQ